MAILCQVLSLSAQKTDRDTGLAEIKQLSIYERASITYEDTLIYKRLSLMTCKGYLLFECIKEANLPQEAVPVTSLDYQQLRNAGNPAFTLHGNVLYNFSYQSYLDTPFAEYGLQQHYVQTTLQFLWKKRVPFQVILRSRNTNSAFFSNSFDVQLMMSERQVLDIVKQRLYAGLPSKPSRELIDYLEKAYQRELLKKTTLDRWLKSPERALEQISSKSRQAAQKSVLDDLYSVIRKESTDIINRPDLFQRGDQWSVLRQKTKSLDSIRLVGNKGFASGWSPADTGIDFGISKPDSLLDTGSYRKRYEMVLALSKKSEDSLKKLKTLLETARKASTDSLLQMKRKLQSVKSADELKEYLQERGDANVTVSKAEKMALSIKKLGVGRIWVDYSDLTIRNITLSGGQIEWQSGNMLFAVAAGRTNIRFRDFYVRNNNRSSNQRLAAFRLGWAKNSKRRIMLTGYSGQRMLIQPDSLTTAHYRQGIIGFSIEGTLRATKNVSITAEMAKSSFNNNSTQPIRANTLIKNATNFTTRSNEAISIRLNGDFPQSHTKFRGGYRHVGKNFQSFNQNPVNAIQESWNAEINQVFWKNRVTAELSVRKNDFETPDFYTPVNSQSVFKTIRVALRIPRYPSLTVGYYPSTQLISDQQGVIYQNQFNTLNIMSFYAYRSGKAMASTSFLYTQFYNQSTDTGFLYQNSKNYTIDQSFVKDRYSMNTTISLAEQFSFRQFSGQQIIGWQWKRSIHLTAGIKYTEITDQRARLGSQAGLRVLIRHLGQIQVQYDRVHLPDFNRKLRGVDVGRLTYSKEF